MTDEQLIYGVLHKNKRAVYYFYKKYTPFLKSLIGRKIRKPEDGEEILQDTLYAFLESLRDYTGRASLRTYIYSICNHKIADFYRKKRIREAIFSQTPQFEALIAPLITPEDQLDLSLMKAKVYRALERILPRYKRILLFKYADGLTMENIAGKFDSTTKSIESALFRARKAFVRAFISI